MKAETIRILNAINRDFYARHADDFSAARDHPWPGWERCLDALPAAPDRVLDVGCGHGRFARFLMQRGLAPGYMGIDSSEPLLTQAGETVAKLPDAELLLHDLVAAELPAALQAKHFALIVVFGLLHHLPCQARRAQLLARLARMLQSQGRLIITSWRFAACQRFDAKQEDWSAWTQRTRSQLDLADLEPNDRLLSWGGDPEVVRYCHFLDDGEVEELIARSGLELCERFDADGKSQDLNRYWILAPAGSN